MRNTVHDAAFVVALSLIAENLSADGPFALVSGRRDPSVVIVDLGRALDPVNHGTPNAIVSRVRVTPDIDTDGDGAPDAPAAGLPSNVVIDESGDRVFVVNHAGNASSTVVEAFAHGHAGTVTVLDLSAALDPANDGTTNAIEVVFPSGGFGPVGLAQAGNYAFIGNSEGASSEDGGRTVAVADLRIPAIVRIHELRLGDLGSAVRPDGTSCGDLLIDPSLIPHRFPDPGVGCFPNSNAIGVSAGLVFTANGGTDDVSVIDLARAIAGDEGSEIARIRVDGGPWGLAVSPHGSLVAVSNRESSKTGAEGSTISILSVASAAAGAVDAETARVVVGTDDRASPTRPFGLAFTPDGRRIVVANFRSDNVSIVDVAEALDGNPNAEIARIAVTRSGAGSARPRGVAITADGRFAAVSGGLPDAPEGGWLWLVDLESTEVVGSVSGVGNEPYLLDVTGEFGD